MRFLLISTLFIVFTISGCKTYSYFNNSNDLRDTDCTVSLLNGKQINGKLTVQFETGRKADRFVYIKSNDTLQKILVDSIAYYTYESAMYYPKELDFDAYTIIGRYNIDLPDQRNLLFLKQITRPDSKLHLYELHQGRMQAPDGVEHYYYFMSIPTEDYWKVWSLGSSKFFPYFEEKMSKIVAGCPELAGKIQRDEKGYSLSQLSIDMKRLDVFKRIINDYNNCNRIDSNEKFQPVQIK